jgi:hypothetical protein
MSVQVAQEKVQNVSPNFDARNAAAFCPKAQYVGWPAAR